MNKVLLSAEQKLRAAAWKTLRSMHDLVKAAQELVPGWHAGLEEWLLFKRTNWQDGHAPSVSTAAHFNLGGHDAAALLLVALRANAVNCPTGRLEFSYQLVFKVVHPLNQAVAWIDAETLVVQKAKHWPAAVAEKVRACRVCGCTDGDCKGCIDRTGRPCRWVEADLCSACAVHPEKPLIKEIRTDAEMPGRPSDFVTHGSRAAAVRDCESDFRCLSEWSYIMREIQGAWHVWQVKIGEETAAKQSVRPLSVNDVVRCFEDPVTEKEIEGDCILLSKVGAGDEGRERWNVRFASDGIAGPSFHRSVHVRNRYNSSEAREEGVES